MGFKPIIIIPADQSSQPGLRLTMLAFLDLTIMGQKKASKSPV